jgi:hypothetical protein
MPAPEGPKAGIISHDVLTIKENVPYLFTMPETYAPKRKDYVLSNLNDSRLLVRVRCPYCKRGHVYYPCDLIQIFGDVDVDSLMDRMTCESAKDHGRLVVETVYPQGMEAVGLRIRRLVSIKIKHVPVWKEG